MQQRHFRPLSMGEIRPILHQLTTALLHLGGLEIVHADLKLENIMVVDRRQQPMQVKLIDFGLAHHVSDVPDTWVQSLWYRAPEVLLGLNFSKPIDMWSLGLVAAELALGYPVFPADNEYEMMKFIVDTLGQPPDYQLTCALNSTCFFKFDSSFTQTWIMKTPDEFPTITGYKFRDTRGFQSLNVLKMKLYYRNKANRNEVEQFVDLLQKMLVVDKNDRIIPLKVLEYPFFTVGQQSDSSQNMNFTYLMDNMGEPNVTQRPSSQGDGTAPLTVFIHGDTGITGPKNVSVNLDEAAVDDTIKKDMGWFISFVSRIEKTVCS
ncbi:homeodomain-interacting protein kinase 2-like [Channa argus]|uniref:homeodomain-interacting protein kinase 2-like n=1 Tax=Channa argus TaxID=215402 RepID=UPI0035209530